MPLIIGREGDTLIIKGEAFTDHITLQDLDYSRTPGYLEEMDRAPSVQKE